MRAAQGVACPSRSWAIFSIVLVHYFCFITPTFIYFTNMVARINDLGISSNFLLSEEFKKRRLKNPSYSLRAFARDVGLGKTTVCEVINGTRRLSVHHIDIVSKTLNLTEDTIRTLKQDLSNSFDQIRSILDQEDHCLIEDWYYLAILNLAKLRESKCDAGWIAERLGLEEELAAMALKHLLEKEMISDDNGRMKRLSSLVTSTNNVPSDSIKEHHRQSIEKSLEAIDIIPVEERDFASITYAIDKKNVPEAKEMIMNFHRKLGKLLETDNATDVYRLNIQFFPLTVPSSRRSL